MSRIVVLTGGSSPERHVALAGASQVVAALRRGGFEVDVVDTVEGALSGERESEVLGSGVGEAPPGEQELAELARRENVARLLEDPVLAASDLVFPVVHGRQGEGGELQALLESRGLRYVGSDAVGSTLAMDKDVTRRLLREAGIPIARGLCLASDAVLDVEVLRRLAPTVVVKPSRVGSTVGLTLVRDSSDREALEAAVSTARTFDHEVLIEEFLPGRELTVGVLGARALAVGEIRPGREIFDYETKYTPGLAEEIFPAPIEELLAERLRALALEVHRTLKLRDFSRVDFRLDAQGAPFCLEANTLPGMTQTSLLPQSAAAVGIAFDALCLRMVELALARDREPAAAEPRVRRAEAG